jgi:Poly-beta-hydroxybutyrate polymerase N terminal
MSVIEPAAPAPAVPASGDARALTVVKPSPRIAQLAPKPAPAPPSKDRDSYGLTALADVTDRSLHAFVARFTAGLSPAALGEAYFDWAIHLGNAPGKRLQLVDKAARKGVRFASYARAARSAASRKSASSRCRRTGASPATTGITGRSISSTRPSCSISNGGTTRPPEFAASRSNTSG